MVARNVAVLLVVDVPAAVVCQYQSTPAGGVPALVRVTPGGLHCGELLVGLPGDAGAALTVILCPLFLLPLLTILTTPEVVPAATTAVMLVALTSVTLVQATPLMVTVVVPEVEKLVPVMVMVLPTQTGLGVMPVTVI